MRIPAPADALRVARALLDASQRVVAERANVLQKSISAAENAKSVLLETNLALVDFYRTQGIEFLGEGSIGDPIARCGAKWASPEGPALLKTSHANFHAESIDISFRAARALLNMEQAEVAGHAMLGVDVIKDLERGSAVGRQHSALRDWYDARGVEFTGWGDVSTQKFYGVGVRWKT